MPDKADREDVKQFTSHVEALEARIPADWLERTRKRNESSPSRRNPYVHWRNNPADRIEKHLERDGHRTWGFVIYRTTYDDDEAWKEFLRRLWDETDYSVGWHSNGYDILDLLSRTVVEDPSLEGADSHEVRRRFLEWREQAVQAEQQSENDASVKTAGASPRYRFCIQVDKESLLSVVDDENRPEGLDKLKSAWVRLVDAEWEQGTAEGLRADLGEGRVLSMALPSDKDDWVYPAIEGITTRSVGWMKIRYQSAQDETYANAGDPNWWVTAYCRPPVVEGYPYDDYGLEDQGAKMSDGRVIGRDVL